jgi:carboxyl-terminal processing protease
MRSKAISTGLRACLATIALFVAIPAFAQLSPTIGFSDPRSEITRLLHQGQQLEQQRRWREALAHYEDAVRQHPGESELRQRFDIVRLHYDLEHRYADQSFCDMAARLSPNEAVDLYGEVLLKIELHYVDVPHWNDLVDRGTRGFALALGEPAFVDRNVPQRNRPAIDAFRQELSNGGNWRSVGTRAEACRSVASAARLAQQRLGIAPSVVVLEYLCGATNALDPYSAYLTPGQLNDTYARIDGVFVGVGVEVAVAGNRPAIARVVCGSPADEAGIHAGDQILAVDGRSTATLSTDRAADLLQGADGSTVVLDLAAPGQSPRRLSVRRRIVEVASIEQVSIVDERYGIGYFKLTCFQNTTAAELDAALWKLHREGMKSLVVDVRGNPGGSLVSAVEVVDRFLDRGLIVSTRGRIAQESRTYLAHTQGKWRMPLVVIVDQDSASAAEIFAGAIRDHRRGTIVGVRSFGKGSVQNIIPLEGSTAGIRLTTAKIYLPNGNPYNGIGIDPDVSIPAQRDRFAAKPVNGQFPASADVMLNGAIEVARGANHTTSK